MGLGKVSWKFGGESCCDRRHVHIHLHMPRQCANFIHLHMPHIHLHIHLHMPLTHATRSAMQIKISYVGFLGPVIFLFPTSLVGFLFSLHRSPLLSSRASRSLYSTPLHSTTRPFHSAPLQLHSTPLHTPLHTPLYST